MNYIEPKIETQTELKIMPEVYSRISGYYRPVKQWNKAKQEEFKDRKSVDAKQINHIAGGSIA